MLLCLCCKVDDFSGFIHVTVKALTAGDIRSLRATPPIFFRLLRGVILLDDIVNGDAEETHLAEHFRESLMDESLFALPADCAFRTGGDKIAHATALVDNLRA